MMGKKRTASLLGEHLGNLSQPPSVVERPSSPPALRLFLGVLLKVSSLQSTTLMYVSLDLSSSAPIYFNKNTHIPAAFGLLSLFSCSYLPSPLVLFYPLRVMLVNLAPRMLFGLWRQRLRAQGQPWGHLCKYVSNCHTAAEQCAVFSQSALPYWRQSFERNYSDFIFVSVVTKH